MLRSGARSLIGAAVVLLVVSACGASTGAPTSTPSATAVAGLKQIDQDALQAMLDRTIKDQLIPGAIVALSTPQGDFTVASGTAERGAQVLPTAQTHFRIASNTKTMTAAVILQLAQEGKLALDDPVSKYVPGVPDGDRITVAQLLEMRSGLYNYTNSPLIATSLDDDPTKAWTPQELLDIAFAEPANFAPGAQFEYDNTNYVLLGLIAEKVDGRPLAQALQDRLFGPLGMSSTQLPAGTDNTLNDPSSHGYLYGSSSVALTGEPMYTPEQITAAKDGTWAPTDYTDVNHSFSFAAGGVTSTAADLVTWMKALVGGRVLNPEYQQIWLDSPQPEDPDKPQGLWYGYGINRLSWGSNTIHLHGGETAGYNSSMVADAANGVTLVVWTNMTVDVATMHPTANAITLDVLDQIYVVSPRAGQPSESPTVTPTS